MYDTIIYDPFKISNFYLMFQEETWIDFDFSLQCSYVGMLTKHLVCTTTDRCSLICAFWYNYIDIYRIEVSTQLSWNYRAFYVAAGKRYINL